MSGILDLEFGADPVAGNWPEVYGDTDFANIRNIIDGAAVNDHAQSGSSYASNSHAQGQVEEMLQWFREAIPNLTQAGLIHDICKFFQLVTEDILPLTNFSLLLFLDTVTFFHMKTSVLCFTEKKHFYTGILIICAFMQSDCRFQED